MQTIQQTYTRWAVNPTNCFGLEMVACETRFVDLPDALAELMIEKGAEWVSEMEHIEYDLA
jgi:hypothetical protein